MKKLYTKPIVIIENFSLSTNIAGDCETKTNIPSNNSCGLDFSGLMVFMQGMNGCTDIKVDNVGGDGVFNGICYHVPSGNNNLFNS